MLRFLRRSIWVTCVLAFSGNGTIASTDDSVSSDPLEELLTTVREHRDAISAEDAVRLERFRVVLAEQEALLAEAREALARAQETGRTLKATYASQEETLARLETRLQSELGSMGEVFGTARKTARELGTELENSFVSAQLPDRVSPLHTLAETPALPSITQLETLWFELQQETIESGRVVRFTAPVIQPDGSEIIAPVTRIGNFVATTEGRFLESTGSGAAPLAMLPRQPADRFQDANETLETSTEGAVATLDPTGGALLAVYSRTATIGDRLHQGGTLGFVILGVALCGGLLAIFRLIALAREGRRIRLQLRTPEPTGNNALGRVMTIFHRFNEPSQTVETLELKLDEAILKETPAIERGLSTLKILAAIAPLLGLLGTVTGMINTFQAITLFGAGDPKLMAGGISEALVTTVLGLLAAIPLMLLHTLLQSRSDRLLQIIEEESAGYLAEFSELRARETPST